MSKSLQVTVGQRYVLQLPTDLPPDHQLRGLRDELVEWLNSRRPGQWDETGWVWEEDKGTEPLRLFGQPTVTVRDLTTIWPDQDLDPVLDANGEPCRDAHGELIMKEPEWQPLPEPIRGAKIRLERMADRIPVRVRLTAEQIESLDMGLDPSGSFTVGGWLYLVNERGFATTPNMVEGMTFTIPADWLASLDEVQAWKSGEELDRDFRQFRDC
jgi:hypothetical protein